MALILSLETATKVCSVVLANDGELIAKKESKTENFSHSENLNIFIESIFKDSPYQLNDLDALAVSMGPGSYTGLRIGVSTAKGLGYGLDIPLIGISSLKSLANLSQKQENRLICPMFDARRMEVYSAVYNNSLTTLEDVEAKIIDESSFESYLKDTEIEFLGPGAEKCMTMIKSPNAIFNLDTEVSAIGMISLAEEKYQLKAFEDLAYCEPFYLKDFIAGTPKKLL